MGHLVTCSHVLKSSPAYMGVGSGFPIPMVNEVSCRIAQVSNSVMLRHTLSDVTQMCL